MSLQTALEWEGYRVALCLDAIANSEEKMTTAAALAVFRTHVTEQLRVLKSLHDETVEYVQMNKLGDPWHNRTMQLAREVIAGMTNDQVVGLLRPSTGIVDDIANLVMRRIRRDDQYLRWKLERDCDVLQAQRRAGIV